LFFPTRGFFCKPRGTNADFGRCSKLADEFSAACHQPSEGRLPFRIAAGPVLATLLFRAGGANPFPRQTRTVVVEEVRMSADSSSTRKGLKLALDTWAVILALALALAVRMGVFQKVPW
jgi:hypothetical protein